MAHVVADRVRDTTTTTGTGAVTLAGAPPSGFLAFASRLAVNDTTFYAIQHQSANEWEVGLGTLSATTTLARTTVIASSNADALVSFSAGTKDVFITSPAQSQMWGTLTVTPSADQNNYAPAGLALANVMHVNASASIKITGLTGGVEGRPLKITNQSSNFLLILTHDDTASTAANRFDLPNSQPVVMLPGEHVELMYLSANSRWHTVAGTGFDPFVSPADVRAFAHAAGGTTTLQTLGTTVAVTGTALAVTPANTSRRTRFNEVRLTVTAATTAVGGFRSSTAQLFTPNTGGSLAGYLIRMRAGPALGVAASSNHRFFMGVLNATGAPTDVEPSSQVSMIGIGYDSADANVQFMRNDSAGVAVKTATAKAVPTADNTDMYEAWIFQPPNTAGVATIVFRDLIGNTLEILNESTASNLPAANLAMTYRIYQSAGGTSSTPSPGVSRIEFIAWA